MNWPTRTLMVDPEFFDIEYAINPHMKDDRGNLNQIDKPRAFHQWSELKSTFEKLGLEVLTLKGESGLPDMVFCANQTFPFLQDGKLNFVLSTMQSEHRRPEVKAFAEWAQNNNVDVVKPMDLQFEGMGDALWDYESDRLFGGYGFRTSLDVYGDLEKITQKEITTFELKNENFYHLDTCLAILNSKTAAYVKSAFTEQGLQTLAQSFDNLIEVPIDEATNLLACNMCTPNGQDVIIQSGSNETIAALQSAGFKVHEVDTSEFIKSGGSVFCMKQLLPG